MKGKERALPVFSNKKVSSLIRRCEAISFMAKPSEKEHGTAGKGVVS